MADFQEWLRADAGYHCPTSGHAAAAEAAYEAGADAARRELEEKFKFLERAARRLDAIVGVTGFPPESLSIDEQGAWVGNLNTLREALERLDRG